ncbi:hypothetical protein M2403_003910 [Rahnella sp. BIGb0603]|uniref:hypothetical protein n=1 Tax=Rahnella sp. BIGb0603 TaxID=2940612 RepID=UPI00216846F5|nr:hypothetical protein [Rahnella sp. BIGb0603]MCS3425282.1 hypothetical protein [Rahnella sp. BIGb0603]
MTTLEKATTLIKKHPWYTAILSLAILIICGTPLFLYFFKFHQDLSSNSNEWAAFGSYIGGVYGPVFTLASVLVLVITVIEINQSNKSNLEHLRGEQAINDVIKLTEMLSNCIDKNILIPDRKYFFSFLNTTMITKLTRMPPGSEDEIYKRSINKFSDNEIVLFENELGILHEIIIRIHFIEDGLLKERAKAIFRGMIPNTERFWLECFVRKFHHSVARDLWSNFSYAPKELHDCLGTTEDLTP